MRLSAIRIPVFVLAMALSGTGVAQSGATVVVIPTGGDKELQLDDCPAASGTSIAGPALLYGFCWYLGQGGKACDIVCGDLSGANLAVLAESEWDDSACDHSPDGDDVSSWFYNNDNGGKWDGARASTDYRSLGYGFSNGTHYGKCSSGHVEGAGTYPGLANNNANRNLVCPCFGIALPD